MPGRRLKVYLGRRYRFSAAHRLHSNALTAEENRATYGKCNNPYGHGHDYDVELLVSGEPDAATGRVVNLKLMDDVAERAILAPFRHTNLNLTLAAVPTTENFASELMARVRAAWPTDFPARLETIRIWETERNICQITNNE